jgi:D-alanyl-D-alanine carboxypeptidase (penicillin-binding protein 5/6)
LIHPFDTLKKMVMPKQKRHKTFKIVAALAIMGVVFLFAHKPEKAAEAHPTPPKPTYTATIDWPENIAAAAIGVQSGGIVASKNDTKPRPIASIAKLITALAILEKHPLKDDNDFGPSIPITEADEQLYRNYVAKNGTVTLIKAGVPLPERDALEAMLLPSANNVADTTAIWAFGTLKNYRAYATDMLNRLGLRDTTVGVDASGLDPSTKSTASDLVRLGEIALKNPIIAHIVALPAAHIPYAGDIPNYNAMVTKYGYTGLKPGESIQAGNTLLFSNDETINGKKTTVIGAILGSEDYKHSNTGALQMVDSIVKTLKPTN